MAFTVGMLRPPVNNPRRSTSTMLDGYDSASSTDSDRIHGRTRLLPTGASSAPRPDFLFPPHHQSGRSSVSSTATSTPLPSRSTSPLPQFYSSNPSSSCTSDTDSEPMAHLLRNRNLWWRENRRSWWSVSRRRRRRDGRIVRFLKKWTRRLVRHPFFPSQPITIVLTLILLSIFAIFLTLLLIYILNPDKEPLPWRAYCSNLSLSAPYDAAPSSSYPSSDYSAAKPPAFPPSDLDTLSPAGLFVGVFSVDSSFERRMLVRTTWASHPRSRDGAGEGDDGVGTSRTIVRFILGQPLKDWERRIKLEMETYNDIIILPITENMNYGKTHTFFSWAAINAWVPPVYSNSTVSPPLFSYSNHTASPPPLAPHDSFFAWQDQHSGTLRSWVRPDFVVKVDDDSFVMLAELESRLRVELHTQPQPNHEPPPQSTSMPPPTESSSSTQGNTSTSSLVVTAQDISHQPLVANSAPQAINDPLIYWGYLVTNRLHKFMAGELYALSWSLVDWAAKDPTVKGLTKGAEDKQTAKWMKLHPRSGEVRWASERCWIYDHPRSGTVYAHGFLYPSEATRVKRSMRSYLDKTFIDVVTSPTNAISGSTPPTPAAWAYSSVSTFGVRYQPPLPDLSIKHSVEALVEGSDMSMIREGSPMTADYAWTHREGRRKRYEGKRVGGTVVVHFIKKNIWYLETALALLEGEEQSEFENFQSRELEKAALARLPSPSYSHTTSRRPARTAHRRS
ncbi:glycosyltransferase family 31 protein [Lyophyllum atratum]|nr:glycosyltransferase family 31 protein [Lyophyllum atratum]